MRMALILLPHNRINHAPTGVHVKSCRVATGGAGPGFCLPPRVRGRRWELYCALSHLGPSKPAPIPRHDPPCRNLVGRVRLFKSTLSVDRSDQRVSGDRQDHKIHHDRHRGWVHLPASCRGNPPHPNCRPSPGPKNRLGTTAGRGLAGLEHQLQRPAPLAPSQRPLRKSLQPNVDYFSPCG
ncbi:MAG: hypothetical protein QOJ56_6637 [Mycobacterium sp.]|nr:hypothetical protein [Mycobacterium sp.]